jgi:hypothetical protein
VASGGLAGSSSVVVGDVLSLHASPTKRGEKEKSQTMWEIVGHIAMWLGIGALVGIVVLIFSVMALCGEIDDLYEQIWKVRRS